MLFDKLRLSQQNRQKPFFPTPLSGLNTETTRNKPQYKYISAVPFSPLLATTEHKLFVDLTRVYIAGAGLLRRPVQRLLRFYDNNNASITIGSIDVFFTFAFSCILYHLKRSSTLSSTQQFYLYLGYLFYQFSAIVDRRRNQSTNTMFRNRSSLSQTKTSRVVAWYEV